jgi:hypothetical protein
MATRKTDLLTEELESVVGMSLERLLTVYKRAVENDWRTVQATTQQAFGHFAANRNTEAARSVHLARAILKNENGGHLHLAGLTEE